MKINSLVETTTSGAVASVASPIGGTHKRAGSMFKGKKTNKSFYEGKEDCGCSDECTCRKEEVSEGKVKQLMMDLEEMSDKEFLKKYNKTKQEMRNSLNEGAMPSSVIKTKEKIRMSSDEENKKRFAGKTKEEIASMARRHGHGSKNPYAKFHDGKTGTNESKILKGMLEADLHEDDLILMPGQGARFKRELMPKKTDHEVEMARGQLYQSAKNAKDICHMLEGISEIQGIDAWVQSKITTAADYLETVRAYLESKYEMQHEVDEATAHEKFKKSVKKRGYDMNAGASRLERLLAKQARERAEFEKKYASAYGTKEVEEGAWDDIKAGASDAWQATKDFASGFVADSPEDAGRKMMAAYGYSPDEVSAMYQKQLASKSGDYKTKFPRASNDSMNDLAPAKPYPKTYKVSASDRDQSGYKPYPKDARPVNEEDLYELGYSSAAEYGKAIADANKYVPPTEKPAAPAGPSLWDRAKGVVAQLRPYDEKVAASNFGYKPQQVAQAKPAQQTPMYEEGDEEKEVRRSKHKPAVVKTNKPIGSRVADIGPGGKEYNVKTDKAWDDHHKEVDEGDTNFGSTVTQGSWVVYNGSKVKRFKSRAGAKAYAEKNGGKVASSEFYADNIQKKDVSEESKGLWANIHAKRERIKHGSGEHMRKPGSKGAPTADALRKSAKE